MSHAHERAGKLGYRAWMPGGLRVIVAVTTATVVTTLLWPHNRNIPFALFFLALLHVALRVSASAALIAVALSALIINYLFLAPYLTIDFAFDRLLEIGVFTTVGCSLVLMATRLRSRESEVQLGEERFAALIRSATDAIIIADARYKIVSFNESAARVFGYAQAAILGHDLAELIPARLRERTAAGSPEEATLTPFSTHALPTTGLRASGEEFPMEATLSLADATDGKERPCIVIVRDVSQRIAQEREIQQLNRLYASLLGIGQAIVWSTSRAELFQKSCDVLVQHGGLASASIRWSDSRSHTAVTVARAGDDAEHATPYDTAFPIRFGGELRGALAVRKAEGATLDAQEVRLLTEAAADLSFALDNLARDDERLASAEVVRRLAAIIESTHDAIIGLDREGLVTSWNPAAESMFGYAPAEAIGQPLRALLTPTDDGLDDVPLDRVLEGEHVPLLERERRRKDGTIFPASITISPIEDTSGAIVGASQIIRDVSERKRAQDEAERERRFSRTLIECMPGILYLFDQGGHLLRFNKNLEVVTGYSAEEAMQMQALDFFPKDDSELVGERVAAVYTSGEAHVEARLLTKDGRLIDHFFTGRRVRFEGGDCMVGVGIDISERTRAEQALLQSEERHRTTLDNILESCALVDFDFRYLYLNAAATVQCRRPNEELIGRSMFEAWPGLEQTPMFAMLSKSMSERVGLHEEVCFTFPDGEVRWFDVRCEPAPAGLFLLSIDITARHLAESAQLRLLEAQREANESLERNVAERTAELRAALVRAEAADRTKSAFLTTMSHELRTPLNSIIGFTSILLQGLAGPLNSEQSKQMSMVESSAHHLLDLINDVLDISRIESEQLEVSVEPFDLRASIERVVALVKPLADKQGLPMSVTMAPGIDGMISDRRRVEQILINLLNNAIKFTERGYIMLDVSLVSAVSPHPTAALERVRIEVSDTGIGIDERDLTKLFQPFRQIDSGLSRQHEGTGLGLAISQRLASLLGGEITVSSTPGIGSRFTLTLSLFLAQRIASERSAVA